MLRPPRLANHLKPLDWVALVTYDLKPTVRSIDKPSLLISREEGCEPPKKIEYTPDQPIEELCSSLPQVNGCRFSEVRMAISVVASAQMSEGGTEMRYLSVVLMIALLRWPLRFGSSRPTF
jgi:hypothetical protein